MLGVAGNEQVAYRGFLDVIRADPTCKAAWGFRQPFQQFQSRLGWPVWKAGLVVDKDRRLEGQRKGDVLPFGPSRPILSHRDQCLLTVTVVCKLQLPIHRR